MGERASVSFEDAMGHRSAVIATHWCGDIIADLIQMFLTEIDGYLKTQNYFGNTPLRRGDIDCLATNFVLFLARKCNAETTDGFLIVDGGTYIAPTRADVDDSNYGHFVIIVKPTKADPKCTRCWDVEVEHED